MPLVGPGAGQLDSGDHPHIAIVADAPDSVRYFAHDGDSWIPDVVESLPSQGGGVALALDSLERPHVAYSHTGGHALKYAWYDGSWQIETVYSDGQMTGPEISMALDASNRPHILYRDRSRGRLATRLQCCGCEGSAGLSA